MLSVETTSHLATNYKRGCLLAWDEKLDELAVASSRSFHRASLALSRRELQIHLAVKIEFRYFYAATLIFFRTV